MADSAWAASSAPAFPAAQPARHTALVRVTHWITAVCFLALLVSGLEIVVSHPRFYWGETGNFYTKPLFQLPIPASRRLVETGYGYVLPDQNGWSRALHFQTAWLLVFAGLLYVAASLVNRHFAKNLLPMRTGASARSGPWSYNPLQKLTYLVVIFALFPLVIWTGLAMSPAFVSAVPVAVTSLGGQQSARTIHFFVTLALLFFLVVHVVKVWRAGFKDRVGAMITGRASTHQEHI